MKIMQGIIIKKVICSALFRDAICKCNIFTIGAILTINLLKEIIRYWDNLTE